MAKGKGQQRKQQTGKHGPKGKSRTAKADALHQKRMADKVDPASLMNKQHGRN